jgi:hypothetical protein
VSLKNKSQRDERRNERERREQGRIEQRERRAFLELQGQVEQLLGANGVRSAPSQLGVKVHNQDFVFTSDERDNRAAHAIAGRIGEQLFATQLLNTTVRNLAGRGLPLRAAATKRGVVLAAGAGLSPSFTPRA